MTHPIDATRAEVLQRFELFARHLFAERPTARAIVLSVSQFWNDQADDEVHGWITVSERDQPVWPHECGEAYDDSDDFVSRPAVAGESCSSCAGDYRAYHFPFYGGYGDAMVAAFEAFCPEYGHQDQDNSEGYAPFAIARRHGDQVVIEQVGRPQRPPAVIGEVEGPAAPWDDPRALALLREVGRAPGDDGPRAVLSDYLLEAHPGEPLGEALALSLARELDGDARARRDALIADHRDRWLQPIAEVIARGGAELDRGLLRAAEIYADDVTCYVVLGAAAWTTVETLRFAPGSRDVIDEQMIALRDVGPIGVDGVRALGAAAQPWAIERLHVQFEHAPGLDDALRDLITLPRLRELVLSLPHPVVWRSDDIAQLVAAPWWPDLERLTLLVASFDEYRVFGPLRPLLPAGKQLAIAERGGNGHPAGWQAMFDDHHRDEVEIAMVGWHAGATLDQLRGLLRALPAELGIVLRSSRYRSWRPDDVAQLQPVARAIRIA